MTRQLLISLRVTLLTLVVCSLLYPLAVTGIAQILFPGQANGSLVRSSSGTIIGSRLLGQRFVNAAYFQGRPSAAGNGYDAANSGGSNDGVTSAKLRAREVAEVARLRRQNPTAPMPIPAALVTASASGLDPDLTPDAARWQVPRVAKARGVAPGRVEAVLDSLLEGRSLGFLGEPHVNVLMLNLALDQQFGAPPPATLPPEPTR